MPGYVQSHGIEDSSMYICFNIIPGTPANTFEHTPEFIDKIYNFCVSNIKETEPYAHGDWVLSNIIIDGDNMYMVDWDNVGIYNPKEVLTKLKSDLKSAFGDKFDTASI
jgi:RIO-like serine/threonine protein kinase